MSIHISIASLRRTRWQDYLIRFLLGGSISLVAAMIAKEFGPAAGGLFLAFPAIFPASATLIDEQEREKKREAGIRATLRGRFAVALDARGAALGSIALAAFAWFVWKELPKYETVWVLSAAMSLWLLVAVLFWRLRKLHVYLSRRSRRAL
jgi:hypothetical protein